MMEKGRRPMIADVCFVAVAAKRKKKKIGLAWEKARANQVIKGRQQTQERMVSRQQMQTMGTGDHNRKISAASAWASSRSVRIGVFLLMAAVSSVYAKGSIKMTQTYKPVTVIKIERELGKLLLFNKAEKPSVILYTGPPADFKYLHAYKRLKRDFSRLNKKFGNLLEFYRISPKKKEVKGIVQLTRLMKMDLGVEIEETDDDKVFLTSDLEADFEEDDEDAFKPVMFIKGRKGTKRYEGKMYYQQLHEAMEKIIANYDSADESNDNEDDEDHAPLFGDFDLDRREKAKKGKKKRKKKNPTTKKRRGYNDEL